MYVINLKDFTIAPAVVTYTLSRDYIRLAAITYQSFGLIKKIKSHLRVTLFFGSGIGIRWALPIVCYANPDCVHLRREGFESL